MALPRVWSQFTSLRLSHSISSNHCSWLTYYFSTPVQSSLPVEKSQATGNILVFSLFGDLFQLGVPPSA